MHAENKRGRAIVYDRDRLGFAKDRQTALNRSPPAPARTGVEIEFQIAVIRRGVTNGVDRFIGERRSAEVGVDDDAGGVDDGLHSLSARRVQRRANAGQQLIGGDVTVAATVCLAPHDCEQVRAREINRAELTNEPVDGWNRTALFRSGVHDCSGPLSRYSGRGLG